jgi:hypothetical protein
VHALFLFLQTSHARCTRRFLVRSWVRSSSSEDMSSDVESRGDARRDSAECCRLRNDSSRLRLRADR